MGSHCEVVLDTVDEAGARALAQFAIDEVQRIEHKYSRYRTDSVISRVNAAAGLEWIECDAETGSLLDFADSLFQKSGGLFDITSGVLRQAWDFKQGLLPTAETLARILPLVGWSRVERKEGKLRLAEAGMEIDFGGFGKEYAADRAATALGKAGALHGYVNLAGDLGIFGPKPDGQPWVVGIQDPRQKDSICATIPIASGALATSGDYERFFEQDGKRYCHVLDPRNGWPVTYWRSVSVLAPLAIVAGSCSTIAMLMEAEGLAFLEATGLSYLAIDHLGEIHQVNSSKIAHIQPTTR
ncbi:MAG: FAD:protein FMN transferase [Rhodocyclaceae bacterium]|nr:MAG: FAD:protein FMN transferase [Rhodocyclaceae bacterium]